MCRLVILGGLVVVHASTNSMGVLHLVIGSVAVRCGVGIRSAVAFSWLPAPTLTIVGESPDLHVGRCGGQPMSMVPPSRGGPPSLGFGGGATHLLLAAFLSRLEVERFFFILIYLPRMWVPPPPRGGVVSDVGIAPGGILEGSLSSGFCSFLEAGCCSVIGTILGI